LPEALINFLAFLGWNPGTEQEIFSMNELTEAFSIERIGKGGAKFDIQKAQWYNQQYIKALPDIELAQFLVDDLKREGLETTIEIVKKVCHAMKERITFPQDLWAQAKFFFKPPTRFDEQVVAKKWNHEAVSVLAGFKEELSKLESITADQSKALLDQVASKLGIGTGKILQALRVALTGGSSGPDLMLTIEIIGPKEAANRIDHALQSFNIKQ